MIGIVQIQMSFLQNLDEERYMYQEILWHGFKYIDFGPDHNLYIPVGVQCNI